MKKLVFTKIKTRQPIISVALDGRHFKDYNVATVLESGISFTDAECPDTSKIAVRGEFDSMSDIEIGKCLGLGKEEVTVEMDESSASGAYYLTQNNDSVNFYVELVNQYGNKYYSFLRVYDGFYGFNVESYYWYRGEEGKLKVDNEIRAGSDFFRTAKSIEIVAARIGDYLEDDDSAREFTIISRTGIKISPKY